MRGCTTLGMMVQKLAVSLVAERRIPCSAKDEAVPRFVHRMRGHADHLLVLECGPATTQPLAQTRLDELPRLPWTGFEHRGRQVEVCYHGRHPSQRISLPAPHGF